MKHLLLFFLICLNVTLLDAQEIFIANDWLGQLSKYDLASGSTTLLHRDRNLTSHSIDASTGTVYAIDESTDELLVVETNGDIQAYNLPDGDVIGVRSAGKQEAIVTYDDREVYTFAASTGTFTALAERPYSIVYSAGDYLVFSTTWDGILIVNKVDPSVRDTIHHDDVELRGVLYDAVSDQIVWVEGSSDSTFIYAYQLNDPNSDVQLLAATSETYWDVRTSEATGRIFLFTERRWTSLTMFAFDLNSIRIESLATIPWGEAVDVIDGPNLQVNYLTDRVVGYLVDYDVNSETLSARIARPLASPNQIRYDATRQGIYAINRPISDDRGGSVYFFPLANPSAPEVIVQPQLFGAEGGLTAFEVGVGGETYAAYEGISAIHAKACPTCPERVIAVDQPTVREINAIATARYPDSLYLLSQSQVYVSDLDGHARLLGRINRAQGGDFRVDRDGLFAYSFYSINEVLHRLNLRTGVAERIISDGQSCVGGLSREDAQGDHHLLTYSHADGKTYYNRLTGQTGALSSRQRLQVHSGAVALHADRASATKNIAERNQPQTCRINVSDGVVKIFAPVEVDVLAVFDAAGRSVALQDVEAAALPYTLNTLSSPLLPGIYYLTGSLHNGAMVFGGQFKVR